ncbi:MAG: DUF547 domain-containing protein [Psychroflexus sp.]
MKCFFIIIIGLIASTSGIHSQSGPSHEIFSELLQNHVDRFGQVDYKNFKVNEQKLDNYLKILKNNPPQKSWSDNEKKAYLINAYNAFTVKLILMNYPVESIKNIGGFLGNPFSKTFAEIGQKVYSLDNIEKNMLLEMNDPRVHFAINCASESCPKLLNEAYEADNLDKTLNEMTKEFINSSKNRISETSLKLSKIFKWYRDDFENEAGSLIKYINRFSKIKIDEDANIDYLDYSWKLNTQ